MHLPRSSLEERRANADVICLQLLVFLLDQKNFDAFIKQYRSHYHLYKNSFDQITSRAQPGDTLSVALARIEELRWRANWHATIAKMLEPKEVLFNSGGAGFPGGKASPVKQGKPAPAGANWLTDSEVEQRFSGYHFLNCMLSLMKRK